MNGWSLAGTMRFFSTFSNHRNRIAFDPKIQSIPSGRGGWHRLRFAFSPSYRQIRRRIDELAAS